jgi:hypothetical protein
MAANRKHGGRQKGAQRHAEGQHGSRTHEGFLDSRRGRHGGSEESEVGLHPSGDADVYGIAQPGHHRLFENRQQHDEGSKGSEASRLAKELEREGKPLDDPSLNGRKRPGHH